MYKRQSVVWHCLMWPDLQEYNVVQVHEELVLPEDTVRTQFHMNIRKNLHTVIAELITSPEVDDSTQAYPCLQCLKIAWH